MAKQTIDVGTVANDGTGDQLRAAFIKTNDNTDEIYAGTASVVRQTAPATLQGVDGDIAGMIATDGTDVWVCHTNWTGAIDVWLKIDLTQLAANAAAIAVNAGNITTNDGLIATNLASVTSINSGTGTVVRATAPALPYGVDGDLAGMIAFDASYVYVCILDYVAGNASISWKRVAIAATSAGAW